MGLVLRGPSWHGPSWFWAELSVIRLQCVIVISHTFSLFANVYLLGVLSIPSDNNRLRQVSFSVFFSLFYYIK